MINVLFIFVLAHLLGDFVTQTNGLNNRKPYFKRFFYSKGLLYHVVHHIVLSLVLLFIFAEWKDIYFLVIALIAFFHYVIDFLKIKIEDYVIPVVCTRIKEKEYGLNFIFKKRTTYFLLDQLIHIVSIYAVLRFFHMVPSFKSFFTNIQALNGSELFVVSSILFVLLTFVSAQFIAILMEDLSHPEVPDAEDEIAASVANNDEQMYDLKEKIAQSKVDFVINEIFLRDTENYRLELQYQGYAKSPEGTRGKYIGMMERILICLFIVFNIESGFALLIGMKTLARFKQFDNKDFAEYYLAGTFLSLIMGIVFALLLNGIIDF